MTASNDGSAFGHSSQGSTSSLIPTAADFASDEIVDRYDDMVNPPGLTNFLGAAQVEHDITGVRNVNFPPVSTGDTVTGLLWLDGRLFRSYGAAVSVRWRPDRVERSAAADGLEFSSRTVAPPGYTGITVDLQVRNTTGQDRTVRLAFSIDSGVTRSEQPWLTPTPPSASNELYRVDGRAALIGMPPTEEGREADQGSHAVAVQGIDRTDAYVGDGRIEATLTIPAGGSERVGFAKVTGSDRAEALRAYDTLIEDIGSTAPAAERRWDEVLRAAFTPGNSEFSGHVPVLQTSNDAVRTLYWWGVLGVIWFRRDNPASILGRVYDTLMPRYWQTTTFIWDFSLSSMVHALLDPEPMRRQLEHWITTDIHTHFGTEWLTGGPVGYWYSVNDFAMTRLVRDYVRFNRAPEFLDIELAASDGQPRAIADHLRSWALAWQGYRGKHELADYGGIDNLLECVSSYVHEVASLNAADVWCMRVAADVANLRGEQESAAELRALASRHVDAVRELYVRDGGYWYARQPDGQLAEVRHCYDFATIGTTIANDLTAEEHAGMVAFFRRELQTPSWMRALSPYDADASFSLRPDHQWNGAYPAWPADAARALIELGRTDVAADWLQGLARSANQGPPGQAHFVEDAMEPLNGGARKSPPQPPYLIDWSCSSAGAWAALVIEGLFGVEVNLDGGLSAQPRLTDVDPEARLRNLRVGDELLQVSANGLEPVSPG